MSSSPLVVLIMASMAVVFQADVALAAAGRILVVGGDNYNGWGSGTKSSLNGWVQRIRTFKVGDKLVFNYQNTNLHGVCEVGKTGFDRCSPSNTDTCGKNGSDHIQLKQKGWHYFICSHQNTCKNGMKFAINVVV